MASMEINSDYMYIPYVINGDSWDIMTTESPTFDFLLLADSRSFDTSAIADAIECDPAGRMLNDYYYM